MRDNLLRNEAAEIGGDGGGGAPAATQAAPQGDSPGVDPFSASVGQGDEHTMSTGSDSQSLLGQLYNSQGELTGDYNQTLTTHEMGDYSNLIGKYKSFDGLVKGFKNAEALLGKKALNPDSVMVPNEGSTEFEIEQYRKAVGVPESSTAYEIAPENMPEGLEWNDEVAGFWQGKFHELGVGQDQAAQIAQAYSDFTGIQLDQAHETLATRDAEHMESLRAEVKKEWGANYDQNMQKAVNMAEVAGFDFDNADDIAAIRNPKVLNMLLSKHASVQEGSLPRGGEATPNGQGFAQQADAMKSKYPNMAAAPTDIQHKYLELRKLQAKG